MNNADQPAMPQAIAVHPDGNYDPHSSGLTKREHYEGLFMAAIITNSSDIQFEEAADLAQDAAAELLKAQETKQLRI